MAKAVAGVRVTDFAAPPNLVTGVPICADSGKLAAGGCPETEYSAFVRGTEPTAIDPRTRTGQSAPSAGDEPGARPEGGTPRWQLPPWLRLPGR